MKTLTYLLNLYLLLLLTGCVPFQSQSPNSQPNPPKTTSSPKATQRFAKMNFRNLVTEDQDSLRIWLELEIPRLEKQDNYQTAIQQDFDFNYGILQSYTSQEYTRQANIKSIGYHGINTYQNRFYVSFNIAKRPVISEVMVLEVIDRVSGQKVTKDILLNHTVTKDRERFAVFNQEGSAPLFRNYILNEETIQFRGLNAQKSKFFVQYYEDSFNPAAPPMSNKSVLNFKMPQKVDSSFYLSSNLPIKFSKPGLYWLQSDTSQYFGISVLVAERKFPKMSLIQSLREPLVYITTKDEIDSLRQSDDYKVTKKMMDKLWLKLMNGNVKIAKQTIKIYYDRVKLANQFFTTHKAGWKTDMGMIFIIFGSPNRVVRTESKELWTYTQSTISSEINFTFVRKPSPFSDQHYTLIRYPEYEDIWYPTIERWRAGKL